MWTRLNPDKVDLAAWDRHLTERSKLKEEMKAAQRTVPQADGSSIAVVPLDYVRRLHDLDEKWRETFQSWLE